jgi:hypothetical protein
VDVDIVAVVAKARAVEVAAHPAMSNPNITYTHAWR